MKNRNIFILILLSFFAIISCGEDRTYEYLKKTEETQWIYNTMKDVYLWKDEIKEPERSKFFNTPNKFFSSLLNKNDKVSFFTEAQTTSSYGMSISLMRDPIAEKPSQIYALVLFVEPGSPADVAGIKRGMWISAANGKKLTTSSQSILTQGDATNFTTEYIEFNNEENRYFWVEDNTIEIGASAHYNPCDICIGNIYTLRDKKVGYILCNNFDGENFIEKANNTIENFLTENVTDVIIDLRYNTGGKIDNAVSFASMLVPAELTGEPFCTLRDNNSVAMSTYNYSKQTFNIGDKKIYFIIGENTKGTAELLVNSVNLSRSMYEVFVIGKNSAGANLIAEEIKSPYDFCISPATAVAYTSNEEMLPAEGIKPDYQLNELEQKNNIHPLGDEQEYLLYNTFYLIENGTIPNN